MVPIFPRPRPPADPYTLSRLHVHIPDTFSDSLLCDIELQQLLAREDSKVVAVRPDKHVRRLPVLVARGPPVDEDGSQV